MAPQTKHGTLTPNQIATATVDSGNSAAIVVVNRSYTGVIWVRIDNVDPVPKGDNTYAVFGTRTFGLRKKALTVQVRMLSDQALEYTVEAV